MQQIDVLLLRQVDCEEDASNANCAGCRAPNAASAETSFALTIRRLFAAIVCKCANYFMFTE